MTVFAVSAVALAPSWNRLARGFIPTLPHTDAKHVLLYLYFAVGLFSALLMEYKVHFYSSGAIEENWTPEDLGENLLVAAFGSILGAVLTAGLMVLGALVFLPREVFPEVLSTTVMPGSFPFGQKALVLALAGSLACLGGATIETALSSGYNVCQFFNLAWGKNRPAKSVPFFTGSWMGVLVLAVLIALTGMQPLTLVNISVVFGMVVMPLTYYPILKVAADKNVMGKHVNSKINTIVGSVFLVFITLAAIAAIPLMIVTHAGRP